MCLEELFRVSWDPFRRSRVWVPYLFLIVYIQVHLKSARLVGVFKTEKRKRESEREKRETFLGESVFVRVF